MGDTGEALDPRTPTPERRLPVLGALGVAVAAIIAYVAALEFSAPPEQLSVAFFVSAPLFTGIAALVLWVRRSESNSPDLAWFALSLFVATFAMLLQVLAYPELFPNGGPLGTGHSEFSALYLWYHVAPALGLLLGGCGVTRTRFRSYVFMSAGVAVAVMIAVNGLPVPVLVQEGVFTTTLQYGRFGLEVLTIVGIAVWLRRSGYLAIPLVILVAISQTFIVASLLFSLIAVERFTPMWWASVSMRLAAYVVLAFGAIGATLVHLRWVERYASTELERREGQLQQSLARVSSLLSEATVAAATLQEQLLPQQIVAPNGVEIVTRYTGAGPNKAIGGDWYDMIGLPDGGVALVIGDVEGHDLAAAAVMGQVRAAVNSYALEGHPPSILLGLVNEFLLRSRIDRFVALVYVQVYPDDRLLTLAVAGNPCPVGIPHAIGKPLVIEVQAGPPLGLDLSYQWPERTLLLPDGYDLAMFTDGVFAKQTPWDGSGPEPFPWKLPKTRVGKPAKLGDVAEAFLEAVDGDDAAVLVARLLSSRQVTSTRTLPVQPISAPITRAWLADLVRLWVTSGWVRDTELLRANADTVYLLATEVVSNALRHGEGRILVRASLRDGVVRVGVLDSGHRMPAVQSTGRWDTSGRGMRLVEGLALDWGVDIQDGGKWVWFRVDLNGTPQEGTEVLDSFEVEEVADF